MAGGTGKLERAFLALSEPSTTGAKGGGGGRIEFSFNPKEITIARSAEWKAKPSKKPAMPEFVGTKPATISLEMFFDASEGGDVGGAVDKLLACLEPHQKTKKDKPSPPFVSFGWGVKTYIDQAIVKSVSVKYTRFKPDGTPIRAVATVSLEELKPAEAKQNPTSGSLDVEVERVVHPGDTLASLAWEELGSPSLWRVIAEANHVDDPFRLTPGSSLIIPSLASLADHDGRNGAGNGHHAAPGSG
jgi:nucleoid-associated protein YgaU